MTEYTTSSEAIREYLSARERTAYWVQRHFDHDPEEELLSPSIPPSELDDSDAPSYGPSDSDDESTHSSPPRMILHWSDGRPDMPISPADARHSYGRTQPGPRSRRDVPNGMPPLAPSTIHAPPHHTARNPSGLSIPPQYRYEQTLSYVTAPGQEPPLREHNSPSPPPSPEHIVVLPSPQEEDAQAPINIASAPSHVTHHESHLPSRTPTLQPGHPTRAHPEFESSSDAYNDEDYPGHNDVSPTPRHASVPSHASRNATRSPPIAHSHSQPLPGSYINARPAGDPPSGRMASQLSYAYTPPAIVYAPSSRHGSSRYAPPAIVYSPPSHPHHLPGRGAAPSMAYSHSAPLPQGHNPYYVHGSAASHHPSAHGAPSHSTVEEEILAGRGDERDRSRSRDQMRSVRGHHRGGSAMGSRRGRSSGGMYSVPRSPTRSDSHSDTPSLSPGGSQTSGSTYYILPTPGQKVQIIVSILQYSSSTRHCLTVHFLSAFLKANRHPVCIHRHLYHKKRALASLLSAFRVQSEEALLSAHL